MTVALKLYTEDRKREMRNSESANLKRRERNRYLKRIERERGELERRRKWRNRAAAQATADGGAPGKEERKWEMTNEKGGERERELKKKRG